MSKKSILLLANRHLRYFSGKASPSAWEVVNKQWIKSPFPEPEEGALRVKLVVSKETEKLLYKINPYVYPGHKKLIQELKEEDESLGEIVDEERKTRGNTAAAARYLVFNGASVRFSMFPEWIKPNDKNIDEIPNISEPSNKLEAIDISELPISYTDLRSIRDIQTVTYFVAQSCPNFDDWCLDHVSGNFLGLEVLDLSYCSQITAHGLSTLSRLSNLRLLKLHGVKTNEEMELVCILLEEHSKDLTIEGITYSVDDIKK